MRLIVAGKNSQIAFGYNSNYMASEITIKYYKVLYSKFGDSYEYQHLSVSQAGYFSEQEINELEQQTRRVNNISQKIIKLRYDKMWEV